MELKINIQEKEVFAELIGRLDTVASAKFALDMQPIIDNADKVITLDCSQLAFISSSGLRLFLTMRKATMARGGKIIITGMIPEVKQVFTITNFQSFFEFK